MGLRAVCVGVLGEGIAVESWCVRWLFFRRDTTLERIVLPHFGGDEVSCVGEHVCENMGVWVSEEERDGVCKRRASQLLLAVFDWISIQTY